MNKNNFKGRGNRHNRPNIRGRRRASTPVNNNENCEQSDRDNRFLSHEDLQNSNPSLHRVQNNSVISESEDSSIKKEVHIGTNKNTKPIEVLRNFTPSEHPFKMSDTNTKQNVDMPSSLSSSDPSKGINTIRDLLARVGSMVQNLDPSTVINDCRVKVISKTESCITNHGKKISKVSSQIRETDDKDKIILERHLANMKLQHKSFQQFIQLIFEDLNDLYGVNDVTEILNRTEEILSRVEAECKRFSKTLPAYCLKNDIEMALTKGQVAVTLCDSVYYGNTVIPLLVQNIFSSKVIASCEVNDVLAVSSAKHCASLSDEKVGQLVGYEIGKEHLISKVTKIIFTTVQELFASSLKDPLFSRFSCIVLNEFFCRSIEADILLSSLRECLSQRKDLRLILLTSVEETALNMEKYFSKMVDFSLVRTENLILPVQVVWKESPCHSDNDFVSETADVCLAIHVLNGKGNVLAFLPSEEDALKASVLTASKLCEYSLQNAQCIHIGENTKGKKALQIQEQVQGLRNIIFTHNGFESVVFPNVSFVVDSGRIRETCYDPQKKIEVQQTSFISRPRAKLRKNCAGRISSGVCYRLYSKQNYAKNMGCKELPELLTKSPLNSLVKIYQYKPNSASTMEFVEPFSEQVKENILKSLESLGAFRNGKLTRLGELIIKLPFLPRYSKLIILGIQWGFPFEAIIVVALFLVKGHFFQYKNAEEFKRRVDVAKLNFLQNDSDTLTFLKIYKQWTENRFSQSWCTGHCVEFSFLETVNAKVNEICEIVYKNVEASGVDKFADDFKWNSLQEVIFECFKDNLCAYTGHFLSGYRSVTAQCIVFLHPSTSIARKENLPQFIVYDRFVSKARNYVTNITSVPDAVVDKALESGVLDVARQDLFERKLIPCIIDHLGDMIIKHVFKREKLGDLEEEIKNKTKSELIVIEPSVEKGSVTLYALPDSIKEAEEILRNILQESIENLHDERQDLILNLRRGDSAVPISISWTSGAKILSVNVGANESTCRKAQSDIFGSVDALSWEESTTQTCIHLSWLRRPCAGYGYVGFNRPGDFSRARRLGMTTIEVKGCEVDVQVNKKRVNQLYISGLHSETTDDDLREGIQRSLEDDIFVSFVNVIRLPAFETSEDDMREIEKQLKKCCQDILLTVVEVRVNRPKKEDIMMTAEIRLVNDKNLALHAHTLNSELKIGEFSVKAKPIYYSTLFCSAEVLKALEQRIQVTLKKFEQELGRNADMNADHELFQLEADIHDQHTAKLKLSAYNNRIITDLRKIVQDLLEGYIVSANDVSCIHKLFCHGGHMWLETLRKTENVYIIDEFKSKTVRLYGSPDACHKAALRIQKFLNSVEQEAVKHIVLDDGRGSRILLKAIIQEFGVDLKKFIDICELRSAELDIRKCQLTLHGSPDSIEKAENELERLAELFDADCYSEIQAHQEICPVCLCPALTLTYRLENCGHLYCNACIKGLLADVIIPLQCCAEGCGKELILEDIRKVLDYDEQKIEELQLQSLKDFIAKHSEFVYCPSPDCTMLVDKNRGPKWNCPLCHNDICILCNTIYHHGLSCDLYQGSKKDSDYSFKVWKQTAKNCKICPNCGTAIQKTEGCNHMTCINCSGHFCWLCLKAFQTGDQVYRHLPYCPRN